MADSVHVREEGRGTQIGDYWPLISLIAVSALGGLALAAGFDQLTMTNFMHGFMGVFLLIFALLKLFDLEGFKDGFAMYDLLARRVPAYGYVYPFIELALALAFLGFFVPALTYVATLVVFGFGALGVLAALRRGLDMDCPCMGNILSVPLSTVTLTEDLAMVAMALALLWTL
ncbi:MAG: hypothetical protein EA356_17315 [Geminicoccaceae bacterium]|nr:MAG: hypothetical protein EA356_17315 [Geminicoccaceae bacterium]